MQAKLAELLLRRKELQGQVDRLQQINQQGLFEVRVQRKNVAESVDDVVAQVPKISMHQVTHAYNWHAAALRKVDAAIQQANWTTEIPIDDELMKEYVDPYVNK